MCTTCSQGGFNQLVFIREIEALEAANAGPLPPQKRPQTPPKRPRPTRAAATVTRAAPALTAISAGPAPKIAPKTAKLTAKLADAGGFLDRLAQSEAAPLQ